MTVRRYSDCPDGNMVSAVVLLIFSVASFCGKAATEKKLVYVTVVSNINLVPFNGRCAKIHRGAPRVRFGEAGARGITVNIFEIVFLFFLFSFC